MPGRRPLVALVALFVVPLPACLHLSAPTPPPPEETKDAKQTAKIDPAPARAEFAVLPRLPGSVVRAAASTEPPPHQLVATTQGSTTPPPNGVAVTGGAEPGPFPPQPPSPAPEPAVLAALRASLENRPDRAIEALRALDKPNQDLVLALLPVLARGATADLNNDAVTAAVLVDQLRSASAPLEPRAALRIEKVAFCNHVDGFGRFVPRAAGTPYRPNERAQFYLEVRNLTSEPVGEGYLTHVHATVEVRDAKQRLVEQIAPDAEDARHRVPVVRFEKRLPSRSPLHDFYVFYVFSVPPAPGVYSIAFELRDPTGRRVVKTAPVEFCVAGP
jgi:hypothetical protein